MHSVTRSAIYIALFVVCLVTSCKKQKSYSTISLDSMLVLDVEVKPGDNIVPFYQDTVDFVGFPGAIGRYDDSSSLPFLILGRDLDSKSSLLCYFLGTIEVVTEKRERVYAIALPVSEDYATIIIDSYTDLSTNHASFKLWIQDFFRFAYSKEIVKSVKWNNELDVMRRINKENN